MATQIIMNESKIIEGIEKLVAGLKVPVINLSKRKYSSSTLKEIIIAHYREKAEVKEDNRAYHIYIKT